MVINAQLRRLIRSIHRWLGLIVSLQLLMWVAGGLIMSSLDLQEVHGSHLATPPAVSVLAADRKMIPPGELLAEYITASITLHTLLDRPVYSLETNQGAVLLDAQTGQRLNPLDEAAARDLALRDYAGEAGIDSVRWITERALEYRGRDLPLWQVTFDDDLATTLYISPDTGRVVARRNNLWRIFDFVWMLHIMDYDEREDFNHPLLVIFAASAMAFVLTGFVLLWLSFRPSSRR